MNKLNHKGFAAIPALLLVIIVAIIGGTGYFVYNANKKTNDTLDTASKTSQSSPTKKKTEVPKVDTTPTKDITYDPVIRIIADSDTSKLEGASSSFKAYIKVQLAAQKAKESADCDSSATITVRRIYFDKFAVGNVGQDGCGYAGTYSANVNGAWQSIFTGQVGMSCSIANKYKVPHALTENCIDDETSEPTNNPN